MPRTNVPLNLSVASSFFKNSLGAEDGFLPLVKITWPDASILRLVRNTDDIAFDCGDGQGQQNYTAFAWDFAELNETSDGSLPMWAVKVSNVNRVIEGLLAQYSGGVGGQVNIYVVQASRLKREPELELEFDILSSTANSKQVTLQLGAQSPFRILFGRHVYASDTCRWRYKGPECGYTGTMPRCSFRLSGGEGCRAHGNQLRFGAFPGVDSNGLRTVSK